MSGVFDLMTLNMCYMLRSALGYTKYQVDVDHTRF